MKKIMFFSLVFALSSCDRPNSEKDEDYFKTYLLFEKDGCKVYRFYDGGYIHYFTNCTETISQIERGTPKNRIITSENIRGKKNE